VEDSTGNSVHHRRRRKHPYRRFVRIVLGAVLITGLFFLLLYLRSLPTSPGPAVSGDDDAAVQFK
jgi:hypothetical protein